MGRIKHVADYLYPYQVRAICREDRFCIWRWCRQSGKSFGVGLRRLIRGIERRRDQLFLSAGGEQSRELMDKTRRHVEAMNLALEWSEGWEPVSDGGRSRIFQIHIPQAGIRITGLPANPRTARGWTGDVLLDEFAMHMHDRDIWAAVFPAVTRSGGEVDIASTPWGRLNVFAKLHDNDLFHKDLVTIYDAVADGLDADPETLRAGIGDELLWQQEFLCDFVDEATAFLPYALIESASRGPAAELSVAIIRGYPGRVVLGYDYALYRDLSVIWALGVQRDHLDTVGLLILQGESPRAQRELVNTFMDCDNVDRLAIDATGMGAAPAAEIAETWGSYRVEEVNITRPTQERLAGLVKHRLEQGELTIPDDESVVRDLHAVQREVVAGGHVRLRAPHGADGHSDRFWALALACHAAGDVTIGPIECTTGPALASRRRERMI